MEQRSCSSAEWWVQRLSWQNQQTFSSLFSLLFINSQCVWALLAREWEILLVGCPNRHQVCKHDLSVCNSHIILGRCWIRWLLLNRVACTWKLQLLESLCHVCANSSVAGTAKRQSVWTTCSRLLPENGTTVTHIHDRFSCKSNCLIFSQPDHTVGRLVYKSCFRSVSK